MWKNIIFCNNKIFVIMKLEVAKVLKIRLSKNVLAIL